MPKDIQVQEAHANVPAMITPGEMIQQAIANGSGVEVMEKLLALQERYDAFQARKAFDDAMASLRSNMPTILKSQSADFGNGGAAYKYEDLAAVTEALSPIMADVGLSFRWRTKSETNGVAVTCIISHRDGHSEETTLFAGFDTTGKKNPIQSLGSAVTYLQRYTLKAAVGIAAAKDDDAHEAGRRAEPQQRAAPPVEPKSKADSRETYSRLSEANRKLETLAAFNKFWAQKSVSEAFESLPKDWRQSLVDERRDKSAELEERAGMQDDDDPFGPRDYVPPEFEENAA